ncbi:hypothetical protein B0T22DRAFT_122054 [Podospora appendiculata]|uniref:Uncharacterized protein n=1 Tax=Podospora appendiculata TaxID=314037 RepID=A0AAE0WYA1_9PEZI|nr:hypothetical protein B0T22DRAFT_195506 [Podospora appendiculata]KAK3687202.1 hypothetical protein B0T22DRAFT_122054 [Podospora appendiculata]
MPHLGEGAITAGSVRCPALDRSAKFNVLDCGDAPVRGNQKTGASLILITVPCREKLLRANVSRLFAITPTLSCSPNPSIAHRLRDADKIKGLILYLQLPRPKRGPPWIPPITPSRRAETPPIRARRTCARPPPLRPTRQDHRQAPPPVACRKLRRCWLNRHRHYVIRQFDPAVQRAGIDKPDLSHPTIRSIAPASVHANAPSSCRARGC